GGFCFQCPPASCPAQRSRHPLKAGRQEDPHTRRVAPTTRELTRTHPGAELLSGKPLSVQPVATDFRAANEHAGLLYRRGLLSSPGLGRNRFSSADPAARTRMYHALNSFLLSLTLTVTACGEAGTPGD